MDYKDKLIDLCFEHIKKSGTEHVFWEDFISPLSWSDLDNKLIDTYVVENLLSCEHQL